MDYALMLSPMLEPYRYHLLDQSIAYTDGQDVRFASSTKLETIPDRVCRGGWGMTQGIGGASAVTALAFDSISPGILYVGSETGDILVRRVDSLDEVVRISLFEYWPESTPSVYG